VIARDNLRYREVGEDPHPRRLNLSKRFAEGESELLRGWRGANGEFIENRFHNLLVGIVLHPSPLLDLLGEVGREGLVEIPG
jgi:hypothetical protein